MTNAPTSKPKARSADDAERKQRERDERRRHERLLPRSLSDLCRRDLNDDCRQRLRRDERAESWWADPDHVDGVQHEKDVDERVARSDEDIRDEQPAQCRWKRSPDVAHRHRRLVFEERNPYSRRDDERDRGHPEGDREPESDASANAVSRDREPADRRCDDDRYPPQNRLHRESHRSLLAGQRVPHDGEQGWTRQSRPRRNQHDADERHLPGWK